MISYAGGQTPFVGRAAELALLAGDAEAARSGQARVVAIEGPSGIGKSELLRRFLAGTPFPILLKASGDEAETGLSWGILHQLLAPFAQAGGRPGRAEAAELRHLLAAPGTQLDPLAVGAQLVALLGALQAAGAVLVAVDDLQLADPSSAQTLLFACRRLAADRVLVLFTVRSEEAGRLAPGWGRLLADPERSRLLKLTGLTSGELQELSRARGRGELSSYVARRLHEQTAGHPLFACAVLDDLSPADLARVAGPLPVPPSLAQAVLDNLARCSEPAQDLVGAAAVLGERCHLPEAAALAAIAEPLDALVEAQAGRLLVADAGVDAIAFPHPLVRAAIYHSIPPARRAALHDAAARLLSGHAALAQRVAARAGRWDTELADELDQRAREELAHRDLRRAATYLLQAADLSPNPQARAGRLLEGVDLLVACGQVGEALTREPALLALESTPRRDYILGNLSFHAGRASEAERYLQAAWDAGSSEPSVVARIAAQLSYAAIIRADGCLAADWARRALAAMSSDAVDSTDARVGLAWGLALAGRLAEAREAAESVPPAALPAAPDLLLARGTVRLWSDRLADAREDLAATFQVARSGGSLRLVGQAIALFAEAEFRLGALAEAAAHAELAVSMAYDAGRAWDLPYVHSIAALPYALLGEWEEAERHSRASAAAAQECGWESAAAYAATARAALALARGDAEAMLAAARAVPPACRIINPSATPTFAPLEAEALVMLGRLDEAEAALHAYEMAVRGLSRRFGDVAIARVRGRLLTVQGAYGGACTELERGLALAADLEMPIERARLLLAYGQALRRQGSRGRAIQRLREARALFAHAAARPFLAECDRELAACGVQAARQDRGEPSVLTPQEQVVAGLVAAGLSNAEVAGRLVVTVNTVEYHLRNIYPKLGVSSRVQLATRFAAGTG